MSMRAVSIVVLALGIVTASQGAITITGRWSQTQAAWTYGPLSNLVSGQDYWTSESLTTEFAGGVDGSIVDSGGSPSPWAVTLGYDLDQVFTPTLDGFGALANSAVSSQVSGNAIGEIGTGLIGNNLLATFQSDSIQPYSLSGALTGNAYIEMKRWNGVDWELVFSSSSAGAFMNSGTLTTGNYLIHTIGQAYASGNGADSSAWSYQFAAVPEPSIIAALAFSFLGMVGGKRRAR